MYMYTYTIIHLQVIKSTDQLGTASVCPDERPRTGEEPGHYTLG